MIHGTRVFHLLFIGLACFFLNEIAAMACSSFNTPVVAWNSNTGHYYVAYQYPDGSIVGYVATSCGNLDYTGSIDSSGYLTLVTQYACATPSDRIPGNIVIVAGPPSWNWTNGGNYPNNCDSVVVHWIYGDLSGDMYLITYADGETSTDSQVSPPWDENKYVWKATATSSDGRQIAGRAFYESDNTQSSMDDTCWFEGSFVPRYSSLNGPSGPYPNINSWGSLDGGSAWDDHVGWGYFGTTYYRQNQNSTMQTYRVCGAMVGQLVWMVADFTNCPGGYDPAYFGSNPWLAFPYKSNIHWILIFDSGYENNYQPYWDAVNGNSLAWNVVSERTGGSPGSGPSRNRLWPHVHPPTVSVTQVTSSEVRLNISNNAMDANGYVIFRWGGPIGFISIEKAG